MRKAVTEVQVAFAAAVYGLDRFVAGTVAGVTSLENLNAQTGLSIDLIQKWQQAGQMSNLALSADSVANSIGSLQKNLAAIKMGQGNISPFQLLGIDVGGQDAFGVLAQLRERIKTIPTDIGSNLIQQIGLDPAFISVLKLSNDQFDRLSKNSFLSKGGRAAVQGVGFAIQNLKIRLQQLKDQAVARLAPVLTQMVNQFFNWMLKNQNQIIGAITSIVNAIRAFAEGMGKVLSFVNEFVQNIVGWQNGIKVIASAFGLLALSFRPVLLGLLGIFLLLEDIATWKKGGKSLFGDFYNAIADLWKNLKPIRDTFTTLKDSIKDAFGFDDKTEGKIDKLNTLLTSLKEIGSSSAFGAILGFLVGGLPGAMVGAAGAGGVDALSQLIRFQKDLLEDKGTKRVNGQIVDNQVFRAARQSQGASIDKSVLLNAHINIDGFGNSAGQHGQAIIWELKNALPSYRNGGQ